MKNMNMTIKNKILVVGLVLIVISGVAYFFSKDTVSKDEISMESPVVSSETVATSSPVKGTEGTGAGELPVATLLDRTWSTFQSYLSFAHAHNIEGVKNLSYRQSDACKNKETEKQCFALMDSVYSFGKDFQKSDYKNIWSDEKQIIIFTNHRYDDTGKQYGLLQGFLYFTRGSDGSIKLLAMDPARGWYIEKASSTKEQWVKTLTTLSTDTDKDGLTDNEENCLDAKGVAIMSCVKTDPSKRDSKSDGWWDGVRVYINRI